MIKILKPLIDEDLIDVAKKECATENEIPWEFLVQVQILRELKDLSCNMENMISEIKEVDSSIRHL